jgi:hypothetical protein
MSRILTDTVRYLATIMPNTSVRSLRLTNYFTVAELVNGDVGSCMSYYRLTDTSMEAAEDRLFDYCHDDVFRILDYSHMNELIIDCVPDPQQRALLLSSVTATLASALSADVLRQGSAEHFETIRNFPTDWTRGAKSALVVGLGGLLRRLLEEPETEWVHTIDLLYDPRKKMFESELSHLRNLFPNKTITASVQVPPKDLRRFDVISITGSTLCNGTLEDILASVRDDATIVMQGQSASIDPKVLFEAGVNWIATTLKPRSLIELSRRDRGGNSMRSLLDGGLPMIYLRPRAVSVASVRNSIEAKYSRASRNRK